MMKWWESIEPPGHTRDKDQLEWKNTPNNDISKGDMTEHVGFFPIKYDKIR